MTQKTKKVWEVDGKIYENLYDIPIKDGSILRKKEMTPQEIEDWQKESTQQTTDAKTSEEFSNREIYNIIKARLSKIQDEEDFLRGALEIIDSDRFKRDN